MVYGERAGGEEGAKNDDDQTGGVGSRGGRKTSESASLQREEREKRERARKRDRETEFKGLSR